MLDALAALVPSVGVGLLFWFVVRAMVAGDRRERAAMAALDLADRQAALAGEPVVDPDRHQRPDTENDARVHSEESPGSTGATDVPHSRSTPDPPSPSN